MIARKRAGLPDGAPLRVYPRLGPFDQLRPRPSRASHGPRRVQLDPGTVGASALAALFADGWG